MSWFPSLDCGPEKSRQSVSCYCAGPTQRRSHGNLYTADPHSQFSINELVQPAHSHPEPTMVRLDRLPGFTNVNDSPNPSFTVKLHYSILNPHALRILNNRDRTRVVDVVMETIASFPDLPQYAWATDYEVTVSGAENWNKTLNRILQAIKEATGLSSRLNGEESQWSWAVFAECAMVVERCVGAGWESLSRNMEDGG